MKIYLATANQNKKREMSEILKTHTIVIPSDEGINFDPVENGSTFYENSLIKAQTLYKEVHCPVIADDSGICVDALGGAPGIFSARYAGPQFPHGTPDGKKISQELQNKYLISQLNDVLSSDSINTTHFLNGPRSCHYVCAMVLCLGYDRLYIAQEIMNGFLVERIEDARGTGGFGYDPLFFLPRLNKTAAQISPDEKNAISHRGKAARALVHIIDALE